MGASLTSTGSESSPTADSPDDVFEILKNARRRAVLRYLLHEEPEVEFRELVEYVAAQENDLQPDRVSAAQRNRVRTALYQHHLDKLASNGFIEYDKRDGTIRRNGRTNEIEQFIEPQTDAPSAVGEYAFGLLVLGVGIILALVPAWSYFAAVIVASLGLLLILYGFESSRAAR